MISVMNCSFIRMFTTHTSRLLFVHSSIWMKDRSSNIFGDIVSFSIITRREDEDNDEEEELVTIADEEEE